MITIKTKQKHYDVLIESGFNNLLPEMVRLFPANPSIFVITDDAVKALYVSDLINILNKGFSSVFIKAVKQGELSKSLETISELYTFLLENGADRGSVIIALGGGVVGDIAGFAAATYMRGMSFVQIPTTLLSQVDSSVGGKTGVDFMGYKNIIGSFYQPDMVYINVNTLSSLPSRELSAGMAEVLKYGFITDSDFFEYVLKNACNLGDANVVNYMIAKSVKLKAGIVEKDENDKNIREILNFGHTFGHAIEALKGFGLLHGECVALGMAAALKISEARHNFSLSPGYTSFLNNLSLPEIVEGLTCEQIYDAMLKDKKAKSGKVSFVLLKRAGSAYRTGDVEYEEIMMGLQSITERK